MNDTENYRLLSTSINIRSNLVNCIEKIFVIGYPVLIVMIKNQILVLLVFSQTSKAKRKPINIKEDSSHQPVADWPRKHTSTSNLIQNCKFVDWLSPSIQQYVLVHKDWSVLSWLFFQTFACTGEVNLGPRRSSDC